MTFLKHTAGQLTLGYGLLVLLFLLVGVFCLLSGTDPRTFTSDPNSIHNVHPFKSCISYIGVLLWNSAACVALFASFLLYSRNHTQSTFFFITGLATFYLMLDDLFMLHEEIWSGILPISQTVILVAYLLMAIGYLTLFWKNILHYEYGILITAFCLFAASILYDLTMPQYESFHPLVEEWFKLAGSFTWLVFLARSSFGLLTTSKPEPN